MSADILSALLAANLAASIAILLVVAIRKTGRKMIGARLAYWLWAVPVLAGLATLLPARDAGTIPAPVVPLQPIAAATVDFATSWTTPPEVLPAKSSFDLALLLAGVWAVGVLAFLALMLMQQRRTLRALALAPGETLQQTSIKRAAGNFGPAVVGVLKPFIVAPADFEYRFSPSERDLILAHEHVHLAAGHTRINAALLVLTSLNWFNPLVHWAARLARADQELACDAIVLERFPRERGVYAEALLKANISPAPLPLGCTWPSRSSRILKERMTMLASKTPGRARRVAGAAFIAVAMLGAGLAAWAQKPPGTAFAGATVEVSKDGGVLWDGKLLEGREALVERAKSQVASGVPHIRLSVDPTTPYSSVVPVIEWAQRAGMRDITFLTSGIVFVTPTPPPPGSPPPPKDIPDPVRVFVDFDGTIFWNGKAVDLPTLEQNLKDAAAQTVQPEMHIEPHRLAPFGRMEQLLAAIKKAGLDKIGIIGGWPATTPANVPEIIAGTIGN